MNPTDVIIWCVVAVFVATAVITLLGLVGLIRLGGPPGDKHHEYLRLLVRVLVVEVVTICLGAAGREVLENGDALQAMTATVTNSESARAATDSALLATTRTTDTLRPYVAIAQRFLSATEKAQLARAVGEASIAADRLDTIVRVAAAVNVGGWADHADTVHVEIPEWWIYVAHDTTVTERRGRVSHETLLHRRADSTIERISVVATAHPAGVPLFRRTSAITVRLGVVVRPSFLAVSDVRR